MRLFFCIVHVNLWYLNYVEYDMWHIYIMILVVYERCDTCCLCMKCVNQTLDFDCDIMDWMHESDIYRTVRRRIM